MAKTAVAMQDENLNGVLVDEIFPYSPMTYALGFYYEGGERWSDIALIRNNPKLCGPFMSKPWNRSTLEDVGIPFFDY